MRQGNGRSPIADAVRDAKFWFRPDVRVATDCAKWIRRLATTEHGQASHRLL